MPFCAPGDLGFDQPDLFPSLPNMGSEDMIEEDTPGETQASQSLSGTCFAPGLEEGLSTDEEEEEEETQAGRGGGGAKQEHPDPLVSKQEQEQERRRVAHEQAQAQKQQQQQQQEQEQKKIHIHLIEDKWEYSDRLDLWQARTTAGTFQWIPTSYTFADPFDTPPKSHHVAELVYATTTATTSTTGASSSGKRKREEKEEEKEKAFLAYQAEETDEEKEKEKKYEEAWKQELAKTRSTEQKQEVW
jgi:hypothetical protein